MRMEEIWKTVRTEDHLVESSDCTEMLNGGASLEIELSIPRSM